MPHTHWPSSQDPKAPSVDGVSFKSLYTKEHYDVLTNDGWSLVVTRYKPVPQAFVQPLLGVPVLCVHGFSQNRHAWTSGEFVKNLLYFGLDVHLIELRGHGRSSLAHQHKRWEEDGLPLPPDVDYGWTFDSYALFDVPAAIDAVKAKTGRSHVAYVGHSMGGMLGYALAAVRTDMSCLVTIGAAAELGKDSAPLRFISHAAPLLSRTFDATCAAVNAFTTARHLVNKHVLRDGDAKKAKAWKYKLVPMDWAFSTLARGISERNYHWYGHLSKLGLALFNPKHADREPLDWVFTNGAHAEPRGVVEQLARWVRTQEMTIEKTGYDIKKNYQRIKIPLAIIFGDRDFLASMKSTSRIYRTAKSEYLLWRPVRGNSHIELTMGHDIRQICYDIKNIVEYAEHAGEKPRSLPRKEAIEKPN
jgi:pimeloyl-ACP methyl ester carboxylesterase